MNNTEQFSVKMLLSEEEKQWILGRRSEERKNRMPIFGRLNLFKQPNHESPIRLSTCPNTRTIINNSVFLLLQI